jgi:hypothetical protein
MGLDMGSFVGQIAPLFFGMIMFPLVLICIYIVIRAQLKQRRAQEKAKSGAQPPAASTPVSAATPMSALELLREAQGSTSAEPLTPIDMADLPDLDLLVTVEKPKPQPATGPREIRPEPQKLKLNTGRLTNAKELMTVLRDENDGRLVVQIGALGYRTLLDSAEAKKEFTRLMKELSGVIMTADDDEPVVPDFLTEDAAEDDQPPVPTVGLLAKANKINTPAPAPEPVPVKRTAPPPPPKDGAMPGQLPSYRFDDNPAKIEVNRSGFVKKVDFVPPPEADIPGAIEAYLQYKIQYEPEYQGREIHVRRAPGGGVRIQVGASFYEAVDDVTDPHVKQFIKDAISEWQEQQ